MDTQDSSSKKANRDRNRPRYYGLDPFFNPRSIVLIDAVQTPGSVADTIWAVLQAERASSRIFRIEYPVIEEGSEFVLQDNIDLAVIVAPEHLQADLATLCDDTHVKAALVVSAEGRECSDLSAGEILDLAHRPYQNGLRIMGPQSFGLLSPHYRLNLTPGLRMPTAGTIAFLSQSGAMCTAVLDWSFHTGVGFSAMVACEGSTDVGWPDLITHFGDDPYTKSIVIYLESIDDARAFLSAAREVALSKPIILLKSQRANSEASDSTLSMSHKTSDAVFSAALQRVGVLRVRTMFEMFYMANILASQPLPKGPKLTIVTNALPPAVFAMDALRGSGGKVAVLSDEIIATIADCIPGKREAKNPIDICDDADANRYADVLKIIAAGGKNSDGILVILTPLSKSQPTETAQRVVEVTRGINKPVLASWMGAQSVTEGQSILFKSGIPVFPFPDTPARLFALMWRHAQNLNGIYETPSVIIDEARIPIDTDSATRLLAKLRADCVTDMEPEAAISILKFYGMSVDADFCSGPEDLEFVAGSSLDEQFGSIMHFGVGGKMSTVFDDRALGLPPLTSALAMRILERSRGWKLLKPDDSPRSQERLTALKSLLVRLSQLIVQQPVIRDLEINLILTKSNGMKINSVKVRLHDSNLQDDDLPRTAIRPYPAHYTWTEVIRDGTAIIIRPVRPEDEPLIIDFHQTLSEDTIYKRYFFQHKLSRRTSHERLRRTCFLDFDREIALAAVINDVDRGPVVAGVGRLARNRSGETAELALVVSDNYQSLGIGTFLLKHLVDVGRNENLETVRGTMLPGNFHMQNLFGKFGFTIQPGEDDTAEAVLTF